MKNAAILLLLLTALACASKQDEEQAKSSGAVRDQPGGTPPLDFLPLTLRKSNFSQIKRRALRQMLLLNPSCPNGEWKKRQRTIQKPIFTFIERESYMRFSI